MRRSSEQESKIERGEVNERACVGGGRGMEKCEG